MAIEGDQRPLFLWPHLLGLPARACDGFGVERGAWETCIVVPRGGVHVGLLAGHGDDGTWPTRDSRTHTLSGRKAMNNNWNGGIVGLRLGRWELNWEKRNN